MHKIKVIFNCSIFEFHKDYCYNNWRKNKHGIKEGRKIKHQVYKAGILR